MRLGWITGGLSALVLMAGSSFNSLNPYESYCEERFLDKNPLILAVNKVMAGKDIGITFEEKMKFLKEVGVNVPIDENEAIDFMGPKEGMYTIFYKLGGYGRHTGAGEKGFAGQVSIVDLKRYAGM